MVPKIYDFVLPKRTVAHAAELHTHSACLSTTARSHNSETQPPLQGAKRKQLTSGHLTFKTQTRRSGKFRSAIPPPRPPSPPPPLPPLHEAPFSASASAWTLHGPEPRTQWRSNPFFTPPLSGGIGSRQQKQRLRAPRRRNRPPSRGGCRRSGRLGRPRPSASPRRSRRGGAPSRG